MPEKLKPSEAYRVVLYWNLLFGVLFLLACEQAVAVQDHGGLYCTLS